MENLSALRSNIKLIEKEITGKYKKEFQVKEKHIDFTEGGWEEDMKALGTAYRKSIEPELIHIRRMIMEALEKDEYTNMREVATLLKQTERLTTYITPSFEELADNIKKGSNEYLVLSVVLFIMQDMEPDARDAMMYLAEFMKVCETKKVDIKPILEKFLPYTSTEVKFGEYSMQIFFQRAIEQSKTVRKQKR
jgi:hypothetical protein